MSLKEIDRRVIIWHIDEEEPNSDVCSFFCFVIAYPLDRFSCRGGHNCNLCETLALPSPSQD